MSEAQRLEGGSARVGKPRFTIVTSSYNQREFLGETLRSVRDQHRDDVEHLVLDGGSSDGSVALLREHDASLTFWRSARDGGQPQAWNEGVRRARGRFVAFINSDDVLLPGALEEMSRLADATPDAEWLIGGTSYFGEGSGELSYPGLVPRGARDVLWFERYTPQPGQFVSRDLLARVAAARRADPASNVAEDEPFDESLHYAFDLEFFVRCALLGARAVATERRIAGFRFHGASKSVASRAKQDAETRLIQERFRSAVEAREGAPARRTRSIYLGRLALGDARSLAASGRRAEAWRALLDVMRDYPVMIGTRAFGGTVQRLLGLR